MRRPLIFVAGLIGLGGAVGLISAKTIPLTGPIHPAAQELPVYGEVPAFTLIDQETSTVTRTTLSGTVWIVDFIFTRCAGQCPLISAQMATLQHACEGIRDIHFLTVSVDPQHDTPHVLAAYAQHYGAHQEGWRWVTGTEEAVTQLVQQGFHLALGYDGGPHEPITHSVKLVLVDRHSRIRGYYDATESDAMVRLQQDARLLAAERRTP